MSTLPTPLIPIAQPPKHSSSFSLPSSSQSPQSPQSSFTACKYRSTRPIRSKSLSIIIPSSPPLSKHDPTIYPELPSDPKTWTSDHVAQYLTYCLRLYPPAIIRDLTRYVSEEHTLTGKRFMRLKEENLRHMGFNERWIKLIMVGVKALRRQSLKDKILGNNGECKEVIEEEEIEELEDEHEMMSDTDDPLSDTLDSSSPHTPSPSSEKSFLLNSILASASVNISTEGKIFMHSELKDEIKVDLKKDIDQPPRTNLMDECGVCNVTRNTDSTLPTQSKPQVDNHITTNTSVSSIQRFSWSYIFSRPFSLSRIFTGLWLLKQELMEKIPQNRFSQGFVIGGFVVWTWMEINRVARIW